MLIQCIYTSYTGNVHVLYYNNYMTAPPGHTLALHVLFFTLRVYQSLVLRLESSIFSVKHRSLILVCSLRLMDMVQCCIVTLLLRALGVQLIMTSECVLSLSLSFNALFFHSSLSNEVRYCGKALLDLIDLTNQVIYNCKAFRDCMGNYE